MAGAVLAGNYDRRVITGVPGQASLPVLQPGCQFLLSCGAATMKRFDRFTDRAGLVVLLAEQEARVLNHDHIGTEHILLGLTHDGEDVAAQALESLGISRPVVRQQVEEIIGHGQQAPSGDIPFTPRAEKVFELALRESLQLGTSYIGPEHILLGLIREGQGVAAQVLDRLGGDLNRVCQQVIELLASQERQPAGPAAREPAWLSGVQARLDAVEARLAAIEQRVGTGPDTSSLDEQIERVRSQRQAAADAQEHEQAASLRDQEHQLIAGKAALQGQWAAGQADLPSLAEQCQQLSGQIERLRALLRQHGIDPGDTPALPSPALRRAYRLGDAGANASQARQMRQERNTPPAAERPT
jgi:hypothetical protein